MRFCNYFNDNEVTFRVRNKFFTRVNNTSCSFEANLTKMWQFSACKKEESLPREPLRQKSLSTVLEAKQDHVEPGAGRDLTWFLLL